LNERLIREFESQEEDLSEDDVKVSWECLRRMENGNERWMAFYNCGSESGARSVHPSLCGAYEGSQQHKHLQFIPLPQVDEFSPFPDFLVPDRKYDTAIPFQHFIAPLSETTPPKTVYKAYKHLLEEIHSRDGTRSSYNFVMTTHWVFVSPRSKGDYIYGDYKIGVNSTGIVGLLLTRSEEESEFLERVGPLSILSALGKPWPTSSS
jgi:sulfate adenylyltransferase (ADP) / ATP adenylyltransferase